MTSLSFELRREIYQKSKVINERDEEIKRLIKSKTEAEILLREVKEKLLEAHKETELLKLELAQMKEDKRSTAFQTDGKVLTKSDIPNDNLRTAYKKKKLAAMKGKNTLMVEKKSELLSERDNRKRGKDLERWFKTYGATPRNLFLSPGNKNQET